MGGVSPARCALVGLIAHIVLNMFIRHSGRRQIQIQNKKSTIPPKKTDSTGQTAKKKKKAMAKQAINYFCGDNVACKPSEISAFFYYSDSCVEIKWSYPTVLDTIA